MSKWWHHLISSVSYHLYKNSFDFLKYQEHRFSSNIVDPREPTSLPNEDTYICSKTFMNLYLENSIQWNAVKYTKMYFKNKHFWNKDLRHLCNTFIFSSLQKACKRIDFFLNLIFFSKSENIFLQGEGGMWAILLNDCTKDIITWLAKLYMQELIIEWF